MGQLSSAAHFASLVHELQTFVGGEIQDIHLSGRVVSFAIWNGRQRWLQLAFAPKQLHVRVSSGPSGKSEIKPITLYFKSHLKGKKIESIVWEADFGRVFTVGLSEGAAIEVRLFDGGQNLIFHHSGKVISMEKPKPLQKVSHQELVDFNNLPIIDLESQPEKNKPQEKKANIEELRAKHVQKIEKAIHKIEADLQSKMQNSFRDVGEWLKENQTLSVPKEWNELIDRGKSLAQNVDTLFAKAKGVEKKLEGTKGRLEELLRDKKFWEEANDGALLAKSQKPATQKGQFLKAADAKARSLELPDGMYVVVGKSALDNLRILREAKPWCYWMHMREVPGAYAILHRQKTQAVGDAVLFQAAQFLIACQLGVKAEQKAGEKFEILVAECRFVRPIKGDKHGRVTHTDARVINCQLKSL